jgi:Bacterial PH domain
MSYVEKNLMPAEKVIYRTRLHWVVIFWPIVASIVFGVSGLVLLARTMTGSSDNSGRSTPMLTGGTILLVIALVSLAVALLKRNATEMAVTDRRVIVKIGVAARRTFEILLSKVESIGVEETLMGRMLGYGTVVVRGTGGTPEPFDTVAHPLEFRKQVQQQIENSQQRARS